MSEASMITSNWWDDEKEVDRVEVMLIAAGVQFHTEDFRRTPWKWSRKRRIAMTLETAMITVGVHPTRGWSMTLSELVEESDLGRASP